MNETYKLGNSRAGCLVCPMEASKNSWFKDQCYRCGSDPEHTTSHFQNIILEKTIAKEMPDQNKREFLEYGVWSSRHNGKKLLHPLEYYDHDLKNGILSFRLNKMSTDWLEWLKTIGEYTIIDSSSVSVKYSGYWYLITHAYVSGIYEINVHTGTNSQRDIYFMSLMKNVIRKSAYCITCKVCQANCPFGYLKMECGKVSIDDRCIKCRMCHKVENGCLMATSHIVPKGGTNMKGSIDRYKNMGVRFSWIKGFMQKPEHFWQENELGSMMITALKSFLVDASVVDKDYQLNRFGEVVNALDIGTANAWALMLCNLAYTPQFNWWVKNINFNETYIESRLKDMLSDVVKSDNSKKNIVSGFKNILESNQILGVEVGLGDCTCTYKGRNVYLESVVRLPWSTPDPKVILYSLYKFAEACGGYYQFTLSRLLDHEVESDGVSPTQIFGLDRDVMEPLLNGLSIQYPDFINVSFTLGLETINLTEAKTSKDVLELF